MTRSENKAIRKYDQFKRWREDLKPFWDAIEKNQQMYEFYKAEANMTDATVASNTQFAIIESMVARQNESTLNINVKAKGDNKLKKVEKWISDTINSAIEDPDIADVYGAARKIRETAFREFLVKGNVVGEVKYAYGSGMDNPYVCVLPLKSIVFNPAKTLATSDVYYVQKFVSFSDLKKEQKDSMTGKGIYKNLSKLKSKIEDKDKNRESKDQYYYIGDKKISRKLESIEILECWKGSKLTVIADGNIIIREEEDPYQIDRHPLLFAMDYTVEGRPFAYGEIDAIYKPIRAQDTILNQKIEAVNRYLRPAILVGDPDLDPDIVMTIIENGGATYGNAAAVQEIQTKQIPSAAFGVSTEIQQMVERAARFSPYASGVTNQESDQTKGTLGGIARLQAAAEPNFQIKIDTFQDMFLQPMVRIYLKMIANLMDPKDFRHVLTSGERPEWIKATKGILLGEATIRDFIETGLISEETAFLAGNTIEQDMNGNPVITPIDGFNEAVVFDVDWLVDVKLDNQASSENQQEIQAIMQWAQIAQGAGVPLDNEKLVVYVGNRLSASFEPEDFIMQPDMGQLPMGQPPMMEQPVPMEEPPLL